MFGIKGVPELVTQSLKSGEYSIALSLHWKHGPIYITLTIAGHYSNTGIPLHLYPRTA